MIAGLAEGGRRMSDAAAFVQTRCMLMMSCCCRRDLRKVVVGNGVTSDDGLWLRFMEHG